MSKFRRLNAFAAAVVLSFAGVIHARPTPVGTAFTYQGQLKQGGNGVDAMADFRFSLCNAANGPAKIGSTLTASSMELADGIFTVDLDFGAGTGTIGQHDSGTMTGANPANVLQLVGGLWPGAAAVAVNACPADIAPSGGDGLVNVNDLQGVINGWGACSHPCPLRAWWTSPMTAL